MAGKACRIRASLFLPFMLMLVSGCARTPLVDGDLTLKERGSLEPCTDNGIAVARERTPSDHIIRFNREGLLIDPEEARPLGPKAAEAYFTHIFCEAEKLARIRGKSGDQEAGSSSVRILVYVHGGLNDFESTDKKVNQGQAWDIMNDNGDWYYPIYISWNSAALSTWWEHVTRVREGRKSNGFVGTISSPVVLLSDVLTTVGRFPATTYYQVTNEKDRMSSLFAPSWLSGPWSTANAHFCHSWDKCRNTESVEFMQSGLKANLSDGYAYDRGDMLAHGSGQLLTSPLRYTVGSVWHSGVSSASWNIMKRRTQTPFAPPYRFDGRWEKAVHGAAFMKRLFEKAERVRKRKKQGESDKEYSITLVGHSMGTMFLNEAFVEYREKILESKSLDNIVYMAAAADIRSSMTALAPILKAGNTSNEAVSFYNLTLNRVAEVSEVHMLGLIPTGSLLVSIDQHHERTEHPLRRTLGSEINVLSSLSLIDAALDGAQGELVFKAFDRVPGTLPEKHGDFGVMPFWRSANWKIEESSYKRVGDTKALLDDGKLSECAVPSKHGNDLKSEGPSARQKSGTSMEATL